MAFALKMKRISCNDIADKDLVQKSLLDSFYFSCLYYRYEKQLQRYIKRISNISDTEIDDVLQESFVKIWKNLNNYNPNIALSSWIYRIIHNQTISHWRKLQSFGKSNSISYKEHFMDTIAENTSYNNEKQEEKIQEIIYQLPLNYQIVLVLRFFENKNYEEISDILKIPEGTVATRLNRAKKAFYSISKTKNISFFD